MLAALAAGAVMVSACGSDGVTADAGEDFSVPVGEAPEFDGCGSSGDITNYQWVIRETPSNMAEDVDKVLREESADCSFVVENTMTIDEVGDWTIELSVTDGDGGESTDSVVVEVTG